MLLLGIWRRHFLRLWKKYSVALLKVSIGMFILNVLGTSPMFIHIILKLT